MGSTFSSEVPRLTDVIVEQRKIEAKGEASNVKPDIIETSSPVVSMTNFPSLTLNDSYSLHLDTESMSSVSDEDIINEAINITNSVSDKNTETNTINDVENTEQVIEQMINNVKSQNGGYKRRYNKKPSHSICGGNYCGKINEQKFDERKINVGAF